MRTYRNGGASRQAYVCKDKRRVWRCLIRPLHNVLKSGVPFILDDTDEFLAYNKTHTLHFKRDGTGLSLSKIRTKSNRKLNSRVGQSNWVRNAVSSVFFGFKP
jgi:hypothetical protein